MTRADSDDASAPGGGRGYELRWRLRLPDAGAYGPSYYERLDFAADAVELRRRIAAASLEAEGGEFMVAVYGDPFAEGHVLWVDVARWKDGSRLPPFYVGNTPWKRDIARNAARLRLVGIVAGAVEEAVSARLAPARRLRDIGTMFRLAVSGR